MRRTLSVVGATAVSAALLAAPPAQAAQAAGPAPTHVTGFKISTTADAKLTVSGKLTAEGTTVGAGTPLVIETANASRKGWRKLPLTKGQAQPKTKAGGAFSGRYYIYFPHGYYRVRFAGGPALKATVSAEVRDKRINAYTTKWKVTPRKVRKGGYVTFSGLFSHNPGTKYVPYKGRRVYIVGRIKGQKKWYWYARPTTNSKGYFKARFKVYKDMYFQYQYPGDKTHYWDFPQKSTFVDVR